MSSLYKILYNFFFQPINKENANDNFEHNTSNIITKTTLVEPIHNVFQPINEPIIDDNINDCIFPSDNETTIHNDDLINDNDEINHSLFQKLNNDIFGNY
jgi:hypothetical protein